ncbi:hypothetical protein [Maioricimonas sp. JC845]|uniref:hypothetical protein n=1 Tax=Maioricimonas sp. JC845 TaxID=3232138 RepID=UPI00345868AD
MSDEGQTLLTVSSQAEAKLIVAALADYGVKSRASETKGGGTAPGTVFHVVVTGQDAERAVGAIQDMQSTHQEIDWSHVFVGPVGGHLA